VSRIPAGLPVFPRALVEQSACRSAVIQVRQQWIGEEVSAQMARRVSELIEVRVRVIGESGELSDAPMSFLWRGRLYVVRDVLGHWRERREWWAAAAARALHGDEWAPPPGAREALEHEFEVWRVEASTGRAYGNGVYDLAREPATMPATDGAWRLLQVAD